MHKSFIAILLFTMLLTACGMSESDIAATSEALAETIIAETSAARATESPAPSNTAMPSDTATATALPTATQASALSATATSAAVFIPTNTAWFNASRTARLRFQNNTDEVIFLTLDGPTYNEYSFQTSWNLDAPWGDYAYLVWIGSEGPYSGSFSITNADKYTMVISDGKVRVQYP